MNTKIYKIFSAVMVCCGMATSFTACSDDFLEVVKPNGEPLEEYYTTEKALNEALTSAYAPLHWPDWDNKAYNDLTVDAEIMGDDFWVGGSDNTDNQHWHRLFNFEADGNNTLATLWGDFYSGIKRCNDAIKYAGWEGKASAQFRKSMEMQARLLRVYYYNILWHYYGNVPFYLENLSLPYTAPQISADEIYNRLMPELEAIIASEVLPMRWEAGESGRVSQAFAMMLYAEMVMYQNDSARYPKALEFMEKIIDSSEYSLNPNFANIWEEDGEWCEESIFEINYNDDQAQRDWGDAALNAGGSILPTLISPNGFSDDIWSGMDGWGFLPMRMETYNMYEEGDLRRDATCWDVRGYTYTERYQDTHMWLKKYRPRLDNCVDAGPSHNLNYNNNKRIYRYAETLLNAAELILQTGGNVAKATGYVNQVRIRAGVETLKDVSIDDILTERHLEFCGEGKRYFDLVRAEGIPGVTQKATTVLVPDTYGYRTNSWTASKKHIPLSQTELDADPTLVQNKY